MFLETTDAGMTGTVKVGIARTMPRGFDTGPNGGTFRRRRPDPTPVDVEGVRWVCIRVKPGREFTVADALRGAGFRVFAPHGVRVNKNARVGLRASGHARRGVRERDFPVFGSYVFVGEPAGLMVARESHWHIQAVLENAGGREIPPAFIAATAALWLEGKWDGRGKTGFLPGAVVRMNEGPFAGLSTMIESLPSETKAVIRFALFGRQTRATVDVSSLTLV